MQASVRRSTLARRRWLPTTRCHPERFGLGCKPRRPLQTPHPRTFTRTHHRPTPAPSLSTTASFTRHKDLSPTQDTIYALSTAPGRSAIAVIRISGPACLDIYGSLCPNKSFPVPRAATLRKLRDPQNGDQILDPGALILYFPAPNTVTGEDVLELHCHGGIAIVRSILEAIPRCATSGRTRRKPAEYSNIRAAEAGEFTKRAFYNNRLDLVQAEGLGEALAAETEMQRRLAVESQSGGLAGRYEEWRGMLLEARGEMEALIDFSEDQHFDESPREMVGSIAKQIQGLKILIQRHVLNAKKGELLREGISVALLGPPNAGKSSLLNLIVGREAAIVSAEAGTTRDIVDVSVDLGGWLVRLGDMAGLRAAVDTRDAMDEMNRALRQKERDTLGRAVEGSPIGAVEKEGIRRARVRALESDVVIVLLSAHLDERGKANVQLDSELLSTVQECKDAGKRLLFVVNKIDLVSEQEVSSSMESVIRRLKDIFPDTRDEMVVAISCKAASDSTTITSDPGRIQQLLKSLTSLFNEMTNASSLDTTLPGMPPKSQSYWQSSLSISHRQSQCLKECLTNLDDFLAMSSRPTSSNMGQEAHGTHYYDNHHDIVGEKYPAQSDNYISTERNLDHQTPSRVHEYSTYSRYPISDTDLDIVLSAEHLRAAAMCLAKITGRGEGGDVEDVLGVVFEKFCVGK